LAQWKEETDHFQFSHFSVHDEFFTEQGRKNPEFGRNGIYSELVAGFLNSLCLKETFDPLYWDTIYSQKELDLSQSFQAIPATHWGDMAKETMLRASLPLNRLTLSWINSLKMLETTTVSYSESKFFPLLDRFTSWDSFKPTHAGDHQRK
jgi:hypothetical protein